MMPPSFEGIMTLEVGFISLNIYTLSAELLTALRG
jgi:hypothetical protein